MKFTEDCVMWIEKYVLVKSIFTLGETWVCHFDPESKRLSMEWKCTDTPANEKFLVQKSVKKVMLTIFRDTKKNFSQLISLKKVQLYTMLLIINSKGKFILFIKWFSCNIFIIYII